MTWRIDDAQGDEAGKIKYEIVQYTRGKGIDVGCGPKKAFPHFIGIDSCVDTLLFGIPIKPDVECKDASDLDFIEADTLDFVFSSHLLEHIEDHQAALANWWSKIKTSGHLVLYLPHRDLYPRIGTHGSNPDHKHDFCADDIRLAMRELGGWTLRVEEVRDAGQEYSFLQVFQKRDDGLQLIAPETRPEKSACIVRYGGFGDSIQASNILPELKRQGYHVTFMTTPAGQAILQHDPHIDEWLIQDNDQVPNGELHLYWRAMAKKFDKFIQLSESVEGTLLALPGRANHGWPDRLRRRVMGTENYLEWTAALAGVPYRSEAKFYPSLEEKVAATTYLEKARKDALTPKNAATAILTQSANTTKAFHIMWCLSGSSAHKFYPHQDDVIANILTTLPNAVITLAGDVACQILEAGWENQRRVRRLSGEMEIRDTLTLAQKVDIVVGPETGVLNAVAFEPVPKVVMLSHSSRENLTKWWENTTALSAENTDCYPCHRLHYGMEFCREDKATGAAACQKDIAPKLVFDAIAKAYYAWARRSTMTKIA